MIDRILGEITSKMQKTIDVLNRDLATVRTGRATPALVEHIKVDYHGIPTPLTSSLPFPYLKLR